MIAGTVAITVALLNGGDDATSHKAEPSSPSLITQRQSVHINSIRTQNQAPAGVIVILAGEYEAPKEEGWDVYVFGWEEKPKDVAAATTQPKVERATVDDEKKTWVAKVTIAHARVIMRWSAGLVYQDPFTEGGAGTGTPPPATPSACDSSGKECARVSLAELVEEVVASDAFVAASAPPQTTTIDPDP
ncbi:hypothetical protein [Streptomyces griseosporeus]